MVDWKFLREQRRVFWYLNEPSYVKSVPTIMSWCGKCGDTTPHNIVYGCMDCYYSKTEDNEPEQLKRISKCTKAGCFVIPY